MKTFHHCLLIFIFVLFYFVLRNPISFSFSIFSIQTYYSLETKIICLPTFFWNSGFCVLVNVYLHLFSWAFCGPFQLSNSVSLVLRTVLDLFFIVFLSLFSMCILFWTLLWRYWTSFTGLVIFMLFIIFHLILLLPSVWGFVFKFIFQSFYYIFISSIIIFIP